jgi:hypothetical protein
VAGAGPVLKTLGMSWPSDPTGACVLGDQNPLGREVEGGSARDVAGRGNGDVLTGEVQFLAIVQFG